MANTYTSLYYHLVFSTKKREPWLREEIRERVWAYLGGIARDNEMTALSVGGMMDHAHILVMTKPTMTVSRMLQLLKGGSSHWIHETFPHLKGFAWQDGYGAFTVDKSNIPRVIAYIQNQKEHHKRKTFQEEYLEFLREYGIEFDQRYVWD
jgi:putative transposase